MQALNSVSAPGSCPLRFWCGTRSGADAAARVRWARAAECVWRGRLSRHVRTFRFDGGCSFSECRPLTTLFSTHLERDFKKPEYINQYKYWKWSWRLPSHTNPFSVFWFQIHCTSNALSGQHHLSFFFFKATNIMATRFASLSAGFPAVPHPRSRQRLNK